MFLAISVGCFVLAVAAVGQGLWMGSALLMLLAVVYFRMWRELRQYEQRPGQHRHIIAKIFLFIGLADLVLTIALGVPFNPTSLVRWGLGVVLPTLFVAGVFDKDDTGPEEQPPYEQM